MKDEEVIGSLVKSALEEGAGLAERRFMVVMSAAAREVRQRRVRRLAVRWGGSALLAASLAAVAAFWAWRPVSVGGETGLTEAIGLLRELDGVAVEAQPGATAGEQLLAWQEAPCVDLLANDELL